MTLLELSSQPASAYNVHYAGWDASVYTPLGSVGIHHPNTDEKAISFNTNSLTSRRSCIPGGNNLNTHWNVDNWEQGTTEPGSSGSAIFDPTTKRVIGYLSGGAASCSNPSGLDCYGKFSVGWSLGLSAWLDPNNTGSLFVNGIDPSNVTPTRTRLGESLTSLSVNQSGDWLYGETRIPSGLTSLELALENATNSENPDLYTRFNQAPTEGAFDCRPLLPGGSQETCIETNPPNGNQFWGIRATTSYSNTDLEITGKVDLDRRLTNFNEDTSAQFNIVELEVSEPLESLTIQMIVANQQDDPDLYVRFGAKPTTSQYDCRPFSASGSNETCEISTPQIGTYYIGVNSFTSFSNVSLVVGTPDDDLCVPVKARNGSIAVVCL
jgi:hypothetical protein